MAFFRSDARYGRLHCEIREQLAEGRIPLVALDDTSELRHKHPKGESASYVGPVLYRHYLTVGWWPFTLPTIYALPLLISSTVVCFMMALALRHDWLRQQQIPVYWTVSATSLVLLIAALLKLLRPRHRKFVVFDRRHGLVHIPHVFGWRSEAVRFADLDACIMDRATGTLGLDSHTNVYVVRPPWDLARDGMPPWRGLVRVGIGSPWEDPKGEGMWLFILDFMTQKPPPTYPNPGASIEEIDRVISLSRLSTGQSLVDSDEYGGDWKGYIAQMNPEYRRFNPAKLSKQPTWIRETDGRWRRVGKGEVIPSEGAATEAFEAEDIARGKAFRRYLAELQAKKEHPAPAEAENTP